MNARSDHHPSYSLIDATDAFRQAPRAAFSRNAAFAGYGRRSSRVCLPDSGKRPRCGLSLIEIIVSSVLLGSVILVSVPMIAAIGNEHRRTEDRQDAMFEVANIMERITADDWDAVTPERLQRIKLSEHITRRLSAALLTSSVKDAGDVKQVTVELSWSDRKAQPVAPVRVTGWIYRRGGSQ